jgi:hypothetical protein
VFDALCGVEIDRHMQTPGENMSLALVAALTGLCFAGAVAAITFGLSR